MSNLRSISEGSFVLGDTNGLTFEAGSGIKITEPSEGTVRIANDETVLLVNSNRTLTKDLTFPITLSESIDNFERVKIFYGADLYNTSSIKSTEFEVVKDGDYILQDWRYIETGQYKRVAVFKIEGTSVTNTYNLTQNWNGASLIASNNTGWNILYKIVGVNRIGGNVTSGGNA